MLCMQEVYFGVVHSLRFSVVHGPALERVKSGRLACVVIKIKLYQLTVNRNIPLNKLEMTFYVRMMKEKRLLKHIST